MKHDSTGLSCTVPLYVIVRVSFGAKIRYIFYDTSKRILKSDLLQVQSDCASKFRRATVRYWQLL